MAETDLKRAIPVLPQTDVKTAVAYYEAKLGFKILFVHGDEYGGVGRDGVEFHFYKCGDKNIAENTSCRVDVENVEELYSEFGPTGAIHPNGLLETKPWGVREFSILDEAGVCITFGEEL